MDEKKELEMEYDIYVPMESKDSRDVKIKEIGEFLKDYEAENSLGGMPLMAEEIYIKHVRHLLSHINHLDGAIIGWRIAEKVWEDRIKELEEGIKKLEIILPISELECARECLGNTNTNLIKKSLEELYKPVK